MTVHHVVMLEPEEPVILNHAQKERVRILHAAQAEFFGEAASASSRAPEQTQAPSEPESAQQETAQAPSCNWSEWSEHGRAGVTPASAEAPLAAAESALETRSEQGDLALSEACFASAMAARATMAVLACAPSAGAASCAAEVERADGKIKTNVRICRFASLSLRPCFFCSCARAGCCMAFRNVYGSNPPGSGFPLLCSREAPWGSAASGHEPRIRVIGSRTSSGPCFI